MLNKKDRQIIINNVRESVKNNYKNIEDFDKWTIDEINKEINKIKLEHNGDEKVVIYDESFNPERDINVNIVFEDFIGKNERLNVFNSCERADILKNDNKNINELNGIFLRKVLFNLNCFFSNFSNFNKKNINFFFIFFIDYLFLSSYNLVILLFFTLFNVGNYFVFLIYKLLLIIKYKLFKRCYLGFLNVFISLPIMLIKQILSLFKEFANMLANIFGIINSIFRIFNKNCNDTLYSSIIATPVNRNVRSNEHKNILDKINKKAKGIFEKYNLENDKFIEIFRFSKVSYKQFSSKKINNSILKEYIKALEDLEIDGILEDVKENIELDIKNKIYKKELSIKKQLTKDKNKQLLDYEKNINKHLKKIFNVTNIDSSIFSEEQLKKGL